MLLINEYLGAMTDDPSQPGNVRQIHRRCHHGFWGAPLSDPENAAPRGVDRITYAAGTAVIG